MLASDITQIAAHYYYYYYYY